MQKDSFSYLGNIYFPSSVHNIESSYYSTMKKSQFKEKCRNKGNTF